MEICVEVQSGNCTTRKFRVTSDGQRSTVLGFGVQCNDMSCFCYNAKNNKSNGEDGKDKMKSFSNVDCGERVEEKVEQVRREYWNVVWRGEDER